MAPELLRKRKRVNVSYKEESSSDEDSDLTHVARSRRTTRRSNHRCSTESCAEPALALSARSPAKEHTRTLRAAGKRRISYRDETTDDESNHDNEADCEPEEAILDSEPRPQAPFRHSRPRKTTNKVAALTSKARAPGAPLKEEKPSYPVLVHIPTDGLKPDMSSLPYHVLLQVFVYASHPLRDENMHATPAIPWLVKMAQMCQAFTKPALTALYRNPPIFATRQNRKRLVHHLITPPAGLCHDYQVMVKRLELDATQMSALTNATSSLADLTALVSALKTLKEIDVFDPLDRPPYRERLKRARRWTYPPELFEALRQTKLRLQSWRWHRAYCDQGLLWVKQIHGDSTFQSLRDVTFVKFNIDEKRKPHATDPTVEELLASALAVLPDLQSLSFESCTAINGKLLSLLPSTLRSLSITNCISLTSEALQGFLYEHGRHLEELVLNHNQSLDLGFLASFKQNCPRLEVLKMDMNYYSTLALSSDNEPLYDWLLGLDEIPTWPATLRIVHMEHLRKWGSDSAANFFMSLIKSAADLPVLRELKLLAMVDMEWRLRAEFRRKWAALFEKVFAWQGQDPSPHLASLRAYREWKAASQDNVEKHDSPRDANVEVAWSSIAPRDKDDTDGCSESSAPLLVKRRTERWNTKRLRTRTRECTTYNETSEDGNEERDEPDETDASDAVIDEEPVVIQGQCHTVICRIDNLRPREEMFDEADFLDEERSGDEEWDEDNDEVDEGYAW